jgi:dCTP deaminase
MPVLSDWEIIRICQDGAITPFDSSLVNPASLDVRLGAELLVENPRFTDLQPCSIAGSDEKNPYWLLPGSFILAHTVEVFDMPSGVSGQFLLKSSRAREGLQHLLAGWIDPGFHGSVLTLELKNIRTYHPIGIWEGMKIGQIVFHQMTSHPSVTYKEKGRYNNLATVAASKGHA